MRIAIVTPSIPRIHGNRFAFSIAAALASKHDVTVVAHTISTGIEPEVVEKVRPASLYSLHRVPGHPPSMAHFFRMQLSRGVDAELNRWLFDRHRTRRWDAIVVVSNEGHWLGAYVARWPRPERPTTAVCIYDLIDHSFLLRYVRPRPALRTLSAPLYPLAHWVEATRLDAFDYVFTISHWCSLLLSYLYGIHGAGSMAAIDVSSLGTPAFSASSEPYLALPTVSLDDTSLRVAERLAREGVRFESYGPVRPSGIPYRGFVEDTEMVKIVAGAAGTLFLFDYEALGLIPLESLYLGTPVITLPKQGPWGELADNPHVTFVTSYAETLRACQALLSSPKTVEVSDSCRNTMAKYDPRVVSERLVEVLVNRGRKVKPR